MSTIPIPTAGELVTSTSTLPAQMLVKDLIEWFKTNATVDYAAVIDAAGVCGLVGREVLNAKVAGNKFGHAVLADKSITKVMVESPLIVETSLSITDLVRHLFKARANSRNFYEDIVVQDKGTFLGLASVRQLILKQMTQNYEQLKALQKQQTLMAQSNQELTDTILSLTQDHTRLKNIFEHCSVPILVLDLQGKVIQANARFDQLSMYDSEHIALQTSSSLFNQEAFAAILAAYQGAKSQFDSWHPTYTISLIDAVGATHGVEISINIEPGNGWIIVSILRLVNPEDAAVAEVVQKKAASQESALARSVAVNLIDKEYNLDAAMQKLDALISFAHKLDKKSFDMPGPLNDSSRVNLQNLSGSLGQFSVVDLVQMLIQSRKSGELNLTDSDSATGLIYLEQGLIVHASHLNRRGKAALRHLMSMETGAFIFNYDVQTPALTIEGHDPMGILMEACAEMDENAGVRVE